MLKVLSRLIGVMFLLPVFAMAGEVQAEYVAGKHYKELAVPVGVRDDSKIEVVELFWYGCPHCYRFEPLVTEWEDDLGDDVDFWQSPAVLGRHWEVHAKAYYAAEAMDVLATVHQPLFDAIVRDRKPLNDIDSIAAFVSQLGVDAAKFEQAAASFGVNSKVEQAIARGRGYRITGVPALVVNGKYRIDASMAGSHEGMLAVAEYLIDKEREGL